MLLNGERVDREYILARLRERIVAFAASHLQRDTAEDLAQEVLLLLHEKYPQLERVEDLLPLSLQIVRFKILSTRRKAARRGEYTQVSVDDVRVCGVRRDGSLWCWGGDGIPGAAPTPVDQPITSPVPVEPSRSWSEVRNGCAIEVGGAVWCWGFGEEGQLGDGRKTSSNVLVRVLGF